MMAPFLSFVMALTILSLNCNGIRDQSKRSGLFQWLWSLPSAVDVVCLQETHCVSPAECTSWFASSGFLSCISPGSNHSCGCIVLHRPALSLVDSWSDDNVSFNVRLPFLVNLFMFVAFMPPIVILIVIVSLRLSRIW